MNSPSYESNTVIGTGGSTGIQSEFTAIYGQSPEHQKFKVGKRGILLDQTQRGVGPRLI